jgi:hypothetical protein
MKSALNEASLKDACEPLRIVSSRNGLGAFWPNKIVSCQIPSESVGRLGELYRYSLRLLEVIKADIREIEGDILRMLAEVTGSKVT